MNKALRIVTGGLLGAAALTLIGFFFGTYAPIFGYLGPLELAVLEQQPLAAGDPASFAPLSQESARYAAVYAMWGGLIGFLGGAGVGVAWALRGRRMAGEHLIGALALLMIVVGELFGLFIAPESNVRAVRILFVHVPTAWIGLAVLGIAFIGATAFLFSGRRGLDHLGEAAAEVGTLFSGVLLCQGSIWGRAAWGGWWEWSPRLTSALVMFLTFFGVVLLRQFVTDPDRRATWGSVATVMAFVNVPIVYITVRILPDIHQMQSTPEDVAAPLRFGWRLNVLAFLALAIWMIARRWRIAAARARAMDAPPLPAATAEVHS